MIAALVTSLALALEPSDVHAERTLNATPEQAFAVVTDLARLQKLFPVDCAEWSTPFVGTGLAATSAVLYTASLMQVRLQAVVKRLDAPRIFDLYHAGNRGFTSRFEFSLTDAGTTRASLTTFLREPTWPFRRLYLRKIQPAWESCHARTLDNLAEQVRVTPAAD